ncbi:hypothetical protein [Sandarakinorhabdus oryzae]|uniref:hypothetical protein n=1 Tax=Sandarakinorhabdus oryzae TaxID=2675220 RepID=UPI0012E1D548|nr:hypothetical protein [Sandarakinorhabdus oryzae]
MLHYLDVMIGFAFTMLVIALAVTAMVQAIPIYMRNLKGEALERGLSDLLVRILPGLEAHAGVIVGRILRDPLLSAPRTGLATWVLKRLSNPAAEQRPRSGVVQREEFVRLLLDFVAQDDTPDELQAVKDARARIKAMLADLGLTDPKDLLQRIRTRIANLELQNPDWSSSQRASKAILEAFMAGPGKDFMAKLVGWFDQTIDRVDAAYTSRVRTWTAMFSIALVVVLHLDTFDLMARLNADSALRDKVVASAVASMEKGDFAPPQAGSAAGETQAMTCARQHLAGPSASRGLDAYADCMGLAEATRLELVSWPQDLKAWAARWEPLSFALLLQLLGMSLSISLLSLGAPFWYATLSNLIKLRSTISQKEEAARVERQTTAQAG